MSNIEKTDVDSDFWKDVFVHMQHKNMMRQNIQKLTLSNAKDEFKKFSEKYPEQKCEIINSSSYITWETFVNENIKLRLFIQSQIKASLLQCTGGDLIKIADAKFPNNPFLEIEEIIDNKDKYSKMLFTKKEEQIRFSKKRQVAKEFIKAYLKKKCSQTDIMWELKDLPSSEKEDFELTLSKVKKTENVKLMCDNFILCIEAAIASFKNK